MSSRLRFGFANLPIKGWTTSFKLFSSVLISSSVYRKTVLEAKALRKPGPSASRFTLEAITSASSYLMLNIINEDLKMKTKIIRSERKIDIYVI
jgi:hypothetical protein